MSDSVPITPGSGANITVDTLPDGTKAQAVKVLLGGDGVNGGFVSPDSPLPVAAYGELVEAVQALYLAIDSLCRSIGYALPNALGQPIFEARQATPGNLQVTASLAGNQTLTTLTNQAQIGGFAANDQVFALMRMSEDALIANTSRVT